MTARTVALAAIAFVAGFVLGASVAAETHAHSSRYRATPGDVPRSTA